MASAKKDGEKKEVIVPKTAADAQRLKLDKLMKNPLKPVAIADRPEEKMPRVFKPPEFIRNIWGSSAGAGSGDFHVYRGIRRREYARQKFINEKAALDEEDAKYKKKVEENKKLAEERTAKKRNKRLKKKKNQKAKKPKLKDDSKEEEKGKSDSDEDEEEEEDGEGREDEKES